MAKEFVSSLRTFPFSLMRTNLGRLNLVDDDSNITGTFSARTISFNLSDDIPTRLPSLMADDELKTSRLTIKSKGVRVYTHWATKYAFSMLDGSRQLLGLCMDPFWLTLIWRVCRKHIVIYWRCWGVDLLQNEFVGCAPPVVGSGFSCVAGFSGRARASGTTHQPPSMHASSWTSESCEQPRLCLWID
ncbi:hypothetical protein BDR03DRAFT_984955 [Suillus americanus]|nr:hypothetical protein BDR03DRAFT_984955 [Suillus americanus]